MLIKALFTVPFAAFLLAAAPPTPLGQAVLAIATPPEVAANPANKLMVDLSSGGTVTIQLRPDLAPTKSPGSRPWRVRDFTTG